MSARERAVEALIQFEKSDTSMRTLLRELQNISVDSSEIQTRNLLSLSVIRYQNTLDYLLIKSLGRERLDELDGRDRNVLRLILYETKFSHLDLDTVLLSFPKLKTHHQEALRKALVLNLDVLTQKMSVVNQLSLKYSHPTFLVKTLLKHLPLDETKKLLKGNNESRNYYLRLNTLFDTDASILDSFENARFEEDDTISGLYVIVEGIDEVITSKAFKNGSILIQDKGSALIVEALDPHPGEIIWDTCAAPGMKTQLIAEKLRSKGKIIASDVYRDRVRTAKTRSFSLNAKQIAWLHSDATHPVVQKANKILIDAPCTSTGILQSYPSFKWRLNKDTLFSLMTVQNKLLENIVTAFQHRPGTEIVYSTCSILPHEGESQIDSLLSRYPIELLEPIKLGDRGYPGFRCSKKVTRLFPYKHRTGGFFIARFRIMR